MTQILRQSTQIIVRIGPAVAVADGFTPVTGLTLSGADEAELLKSNTTTTTDISGATIAAITGCDGWYGVTLTTSHTDTVGPLDLMINDDSLMLPIFARFQVVEEAVYDKLYAASATGNTAAVLTIASDLVIVASDLLQVYSDTTIVASDLVQVYSDTTLLVTNLAAVDSQVTATDSQLTVTDAVADTIASDLLIISGIISDIYSDTVIISSDTAVIEAGGGSLTATQASQLTRIQSDVISQFAVVEPYVSDIYSDTTAIEAGGGALTATQASQLARVQSDLIIAQSDIIIIGSDIVSQFAVIEPYVSDIYSDTTAIHTQTTGIYSDTTIISSDTTLLEASRGVIDEGTAQSATGTTLVLRSGADFADDELIGATIVIISATAGDGQARRITDYVGATDTATVATWTTTPTGTITYKIYATTDSSGALTATQESQLTRIQSDLIIAQSDLIIIGSDLLQVYSDTTLLVTNVATVDTVVDTIASDLLVMSGVVSDIYSDTVIITSDTTAIHSDTTAVHSDTTAMHTQTTTIASDLVQVYSDTTLLVTNLAAVDSQVTATDSQLTVTDAVADTIASDLLIVSGIVSDIYSDTVIISSDTTRLELGIISGTAVTGTLSTTQASTDLTGYTNDQLIGRVCIWLAGPADGEATRITDYVETNGVLTFDALTLAPENTNAFKIV